MAECALARRECGSRELAWRFPPDDALVDASARGPAGNRKIPRRSAALVPGCENHSAIRRFRPWAENAHTSALPAVSENAIARGFLPAADRANRHRSARVPRK